MSLLHSVITDAHPRKSNGELPFNASAAIGWRNRESNRDTPQTEVQSAETLVQTSHLSRSLPNEKSASELIEYDASGLFQLDNPIEQEIQGKVKNSEQAPSLSGSEKMRATNNGFGENHPPIPGEQSHLTIHTANAQDLVTYSENNKIISHLVTDSISFPEDIEEALMKNENNNVVNAAHQEKEDTRKFDKHNLIIVNAEKNTSGQEELAITTSFQKSKEDMPGKNAIANDANIVHQGKESTRLSEKHESQISFAEENTTARGEISETIAFDENRHTERSIKSSVGLTADSVGRNEPQQSLVDGTQPNRVPQDVDKQANFQLSSNPEVNRRLQNQDNAKVTGDEQLVSRQSIAKDLHTSSDRTLSPILQSVGKQGLMQANSPATISSNSPGSVPSKSGNSTKQISRPLRSLTISEALRSISATPFKPDSIPKSGDTFRLEPPLRSLKTKHEAPKVQIGQIDVIIEAAAQPIAKQATASSPIDLASRHYLRRL